jgi:hypothetical protein
MDDEAFMIAMVDVLMKIIVKDYMGGTMSQAM